MLQPIRIHALYFPELQSLDIASLPHAKHQVNTYEADEKYH
jgi:hypothetical protein